MNKGADLFKFAYDTVLQRWKDNSEDAWKVAVIQAKDARNQSVVREFAREVEKVVDELEKGPTIEKKSKGEKVLKA